MFPTVLILGKGLGICSYFGLSSMPVMALPVTECPGDSTERNGNDVINDEVAAAMCDMVFG